MPATLLPVRNIARMAASHKHPSRRPYEHREGLWTRACISEVKRSEASHSGEKCPDRRPCRVKEGRRGGPGL